jgi:hypothetical protein
MAGYNYDKLGVTAKKITEYLTKKGVKASVKVSRYQKEIKAVEVAAPVPLETFLKDNAIAGKITDLTSVEEKSISGKYKAKLVTITTANTAVAKGEMFFLVNTYTEKGSLKTKDLAPEKFNLTTSKFSTAVEFDNAVTKGIKGNNTLPLDIKNTITELYKSVAANTATKDLVPFNAAAKKAMALVKPQDKQAIGKDFGEILSMRWYITQSWASTWKECFFSQISNEALVDFVVMKKEGKEIVKKDISAKFEAGAAPSIGAIVGKIDEVYKAPLANEKVAIGVLQALAADGANTSTKILAAMKTINHPAYKVLQKIVGKKTAFTIQDISEHIAAIAKAGKTADARIKLFKTAYKEYYDVLGKNASEDSISVVFSAPTFKKYYSLVMAPMGYALVDYMNKQAVYQDILNKISQQMKTEQVYLDFIGENMRFTKKLFSKASFKFAYGANAKDSDNTGIKFSML